MEASFTYVISNKISCSGPNIDERETYPYKIIHKLVPRLCLIWVYTLCLDKMILRERNAISNFEIMTFATTKYTMGTPKFIVSNQREECMSKQMVN